MASPQCASLRYLDQMAPVALSGHADTIMQLLDVPDKCGEALRQLRRLSPQTLLAYIHAESSRVRREAIIAIANWGPKALRQHAHAVAECLEDSDGKVRGEAVKALSTLSLPAVEPHVGAILRLLADEDAFARVAVVVAFCKLRLVQLAEEGIGGVVRCLQDRDMNVRRAAKATTYTILSRGCAKVRSSVVEAFAGLEPEVLAEHANAIVQQLGGAAAVREAAVNTLGSLAPPALARHKGAVMGLIDDRDGRVRLAVVRTVSTLEPPELATVVDDVLGRLSDEDTAVRQAVAEMLGRLQPGTLAMHAGAIVLLCEDASPHLREKAILVLSRLEPPALAGHIAKIEHRLGDEASAVRLAAVKAIQQLQSAVLAEHAGTVVRLLRDHSDAVRAAAAVALGRLGPAAMAEHASAMVQGLSDDSGPVREAVARVICNHPAALLHARRACADGTPLHLAARQGYLDICQRLVWAGAPFRVKNDRGLTPMDLARLNGHTGVASFFESRRNLFSFRSGSGDALMQALADVRPVIKVEWYTMRLDGLAGVFRACHSFVAVTVGDAERMQYTYVLEKTADSWLDNQRDGATPTNGVLISHWFDVAPRVDTTAIHTLEGARIANRGEGELCMRSLRDVAVDIGPYDVAKCNCHHAAMAVYNACAARGSVVQHIPDRFLTLGASLAKACGVDIARCESGVGSRSVPHVEVASLSYAGHLYEPGRFPLAANCVGGAQCWTSPAAQLSEWIYHPADGRLFSICNGTRDEVVLEVTGPGQGGGGPVRLRPGASRHLGVPGETARARISRPPRGPRWRGRECSAEVDLSTAHSYCIQEGPGGAPRCTAYSPLPAELEVHRLTVAGDGNVVQWAVVASPDTVYVAFRGTAEVMDAVVDMGFVTHDDADHGLRVHGAMWNALHQRRHPVVEDIAARVRAVREARAGLVHVVLCGHSLGGGYAILAALDMLHRGMEVTAVMTFGAPQVVVPDHDRPIWRALHARTTLYINQYDVVPRLPSCLEWLFDVVPRSLALGGSFGAVRVGVDLRGLLESRLDHQKEIMAEYGTVGTLAFVRADSRSARKVPTSADLTHWKELSGLPSPTGKFIFDQHRCTEYVSIAASLAQSGDVHGDQ